MAPSGFRVIVVGGGPTGLTAAHMLSKAGIDFVLLEKRDTCMAEIGAALVVGPGTARVYDQLVTHGGRYYNTHHLFRWIAENHGHRPLAMNRPELVKLLYDSLSENDKARILTGKGVFSVETHKDKVVVKCTDGTAEEGSIVIGADGVHSEVRSAMRRLALKQSPTAKVNEEKPFLTTYRCLFGTTPLIPGLYPGETWGGHGGKASTQTFVGRDRAWFFLYEELERPTRERNQYSKEDAARYAERWANLAITDRLKVKDLYHAALKCTLVDLQEGLLDVFSWDRLVLVGDALCKHTPNAGNGYNSGVQDLVVLVTGLYRLLHGLPKGHVVDSDAIKAVFEEFQRVREKELHELQQRSAAMTRLQAWATWKDWLIERWIVPSLCLDKALIQALGAAANKNIQVLPFLEEQDLLHGKIPWENYPEGIEKRPAKHNDLNWGRLLVVILVVAVALGLTRSALLSRIGISSYGIHLSQFARTLDYIVKHKIE
ncbi:hypothetical protein DL768_011183 [Monosporascus sp. mg162]|nr:hypothetical protein DL768_011183 [Monosporascus sp. mg162]